MNLRQLIELPCESTLIYSRVFLEECGVVSSCARIRKRRDPVLSRQRPKRFEEFVEDRLLPSS